MSLTLLGELDYVAIALVAIASYVLGGVWFAVLFAKPWSRAYGYEEGEALRLWKNPALTLTVLLFGDLAGAVVIDLLMVALDLRSAAQGAGIGFLLWLGAGGAYGLGVQLASGRSVRGYWIDTGRHLVSLLLMGALLGFWR